MELVGKWRLLYPFEADYDGAASRAYYAAFYSVSALFAMEGKTFKRHSAVEGAVHNDLVRTGRWIVDLGKAFSFLRETRTTGDYGGDLHTTCWGGFQMIVKSLLDFKILKRIQTL